MKKRNLLLVLTMVVLLLIAAGCGQKETPQPGDETQPVVSKTVRIGMIAAEGHPVVVGAEKFKELVEARTDGRYDIQIFPGGTLGQEMELKDQVAMGTIEMANLGSGIMVGAVPETQVFQFFYLWDDPDHMTRGYNSDVATELLAKFERESGSKILAKNWYQGTRHLLTKKAVYEPKDLVGVKVRVPAGLPLWNELWETMGATTISLGFSEVYTGLQQGVIDAIEVPFDWMVNGEIYKQAKYVVLTSHVSYPNLMLINNDFFASLSAEDQAIFEEAAIEAGRLCTQLVVEGENQQRAIMEADGIEFIEVDLDVFREAVKPVAEAWEDSFGEGVYERITAIQ